MSKKSKLEMEKMSLMERLKQITGSIAFLDRRKKRMMIIGGVVVVVVVAAIIFG